jgi:phosphatidylinositol glycan class O
MPPKAAAPRKEVPAPPSADPVAKVGDYKSIAAQYAKAKALKEKEDALAAAAAIKKAAGSGGKTGSEQEQGVVRAKERRTDAERINKRKEGVFKKAWTWSLGFYVWLL